MRMKRLSGNGLRWYTTGLSHLKNTMFSQTKKNSYAVWRTLRLVNHANETAYREGLDNIDVDGNNWRFYSVSGGGVIPDRTIVVPVNNENVD
jgi:hypothetical protein